MTAEQEEIAKTLGIGRRRHASWRWIAVAGGAILLVAAVLFYRGATSGEQVRYVTEEARRGDLEVTVSATGSVEPTDLFDISSELSGTIAAVHVDFNDTVEKGMVLATLDTSKLEAQRAVQEASLAAAEARVAIAEVSLDEARKTFERGLELSRRGVAAEQTFIAQEAGYERAKAELQAAIANRDLAKANLEVVKVDLTKSCICSPVNGVVLDRAVDVGQIVAASLSAPVLFTVAEDIARMELQIDIDEADIGRVEVGQEARFTVDAYDERVFPAQITELYFAPETVDGVVTYKGILTLDNSDMALRPGMTATADVVVTSVADALLVPNAALRYTPPVETEEDNGQGGSGLVGLMMSRRPDRGRSGGAAEARKSVWVLRGGQAEEVAVETGETDGLVTIIRSGDLKEGDRVITDRFNGN